MKQWILFIAGFLSFLAIVLTILILILGNKPFSDAEETAIAKVKDENLLSEVSRSYVYSNDQKSVTVIGTDSEGKLKAVFVPMGGQELSETELEGKITAQEARGIAFKEMEVKEVLHTKLGQEDNKTIWEVVFLTENDKLNYVYISAEDGSVYKRILNL
ncbi:MULTISPECIES: cell wall elongation regulator TseB-like domain-containing protein [Planomicrobium]|uniref:DUF5590 domain-containing protein n=1 Tax=Planomicrobium okeanokoites TaxID=244 RepID=A0ABV7KPU3_PLAOK|nr:MULTISPECIES: DUF5590 domain-containing protein [Planomicrobium]PKH10018.1 hypothetical protein CXF70_12485 [Planomicrobium sp. MB-3u-38]TAA71252.1 hypothetical protein D2910_02960 [Planomicrobium okeanokoites]